MHFSQRTLKKETDSQSDGKRKIPEWFEKGGHSTSETLVVVPSIRVSFTGNRVTPITFGGDPLKVNPAAKRKQKNMDHVAHVFEVRTV